MTPHSTINFISNKYRILGKIGEGTFSEVQKCQDNKDGTFWACKKMKQRYVSQEQVNSLREVQALRRLSPHVNILELREVLFDQPSGTLVLICELMDMNMYELIKGKRQYLPEDKVQSYMYQVLKSVDHMHKNGIFHRDVKPENILIKNDLVKLADFGSCRSVFSKPPYTEYISTRWYRAPECLLTDGFYSYKMDIWSIGCVFFEILSLHPLFPGSNELDQISKIHDIVGTPSPSVIGKLRNKTRGINFNFHPKTGSGIRKLLPHGSRDSVDLITLMCQYDPDERISARSALKHAFFKNLRDAEKRASRAQSLQNSEVQDNLSEKSKSNLSQSYLNQISVNVISKNPIHRLEKRLRKPKPAYNTNDRLQRAASKTSLPNSLPGGTYHALPGGLPKVNPPAAKAHSYQGNFSRTSAYAQPHNANYLPSISQAFSKQVNESKLNLGGNYSIPTNYHPLINQQEDTLIKKSI